MGAHADCYIAWHQILSHGSSPVCATEKDTELPDIHNFRVIDMNKLNWTSMFLARRDIPSPPPPAPNSCNLIMGPYGDKTDGDAFDDLAYSAWGKMPITRISYRATTNESMVYALQFTYGSTAAPQHGGALGTAGEFELKSGEQITGAVVQFDDTTILAITFETNKKRALTIGSPQQGAGQARATPCPASSGSAGKYRLIAIAGRFDIRVRSLSLIWA